MLTVHRLKHQSKHPLLNSCKEQWMLPTVWVPVWGGVCVFLFVCVCSVMCGWLAGACFGDETAKKTSAWTRLTLEYPSLCPAATLLHPEPLCIGRSLVQEYGVLPIWDREGGQTGPRWTLLAGDSDRPNTHSHAHSSAHLDIKTHSLMHARSHTRAHPYLQHSCTPKQTETTRIWLVIQRWAV